MIRDKNVDRVLRIDEGVFISGYSRPSIYRLMKQGAFPKSFKLGAGDSSASGWRLSAIEEWVSKKEQGVAA